MYNDESMHLDRGPISSVRARVRGLVIYHIITSPKRNYAVCLFVSIGYDKQDAAKKQTLKYIIYVSTLYMP